MNMQTHTIRINNNANNIIINYIPNPEAVFKKNNEDK